MASANEVIFQRHFW